MTCSPQSSDYNVNQPSGGNGKVELPQAAVNLTGSTPIQTKWVKPQGAYHHIDHEIASLNTSYDGAQQTQTNSYYNQDPNRESYSNPQIVGPVSINPTLIDHQESYPVYNRASNWFGAAGDEPSSVCNNYGNYETHNQQENIQTYCQQQQIHPQCLHQYPMENYVPPTPYTTSGHNFTNYVHNQHNPNFDPNRFQYHDYHFPVQPANSGESLQHSNIWTEPSYEHSVTVRVKPESSTNNNPYTSLPEIRLPDISNQSWPTESHQPAEESQDQPQINKEHVKFKPSPAQKACNVKQSPSDSGPTIRTNQCGVCGRNYARPSTLKTHLRTHTNERPFKCNVCLKTFSQAANLTAHQRVHTGERPFSCPICGRQFSQSSSVITHLRTHSGERPYRCSMCSRTFSDSSTLTKHCRIHSGEKPYQCDYCPLNFSQSGNLSRHLKLHSAGAASSSSNSSSSSCSSSSTSTSSSSVTLSSQLSTSCSSANGTHNASDKNCLYAPQNESTISKQPN